MSLFCYKTHFTILLLRKNKFSNFIQNAPFPLPGRNISPVYGPSGFLKLLFSLLNHFQSCYLLFLFLLAQVTIDKQTMRILTCKHRKTQCLPIWTRSVWIWCRWTGSTNHFSWQRSNPMISSHAPVEQTTKASERKRQEKLRMRMHLEKSRKRETIHGAVGYYIEILKPSWYFTVWKMTA